MMKEKPGDWSRTICPYIRQPHVCRKYSQPVCIISAFPSPIFWHCDNQKVLLYIFKYSQLRVTM